MNNERRKQIDAVLALVTEARAKLEEIRDDEQQYLDNLPDNMPSRRRSSRLEDAVSNLETVESDLEDAKS